MDGQGFQYKMLVVKKKMMDPEKSDNSGTNFMETGAKPVALLWTPGKSINWNVRCFFSCCTIVYLCVLELT